MTEDAQSVKPIIIKRVRKKAHDFHGGSWKVAFADFATAMMAFFLLLWLVGNTSQDQKKAISGYFNDPSGFQEKTGSSPSVIGEGGANVGVIELADVQPETKEVEAEIDEDELAKLAEEKEIAKLTQLKQELESLAQASPIFSQYKDQIIIDITPAGLRIQIVDKDKRPMFDSGAADLKGYSEVILRNLSQVLTRVPNKLSITGHTDATPYLERENYGNWELSTDRANAARRALVRGGVKQEKIARVEGFASSILFDKENSHNPINRRIAIIVLKQSAAEDIENQVLGLD